LKIAALNIAFYIPYIPFKGKIGLCIPYLPNWEAKACKRPLQRDRNNLLGHFLAPKKVCKRPIQRDLEKAFKRP